MVVALAVLLNTVTAEALEGTLGCDGAATRSTVWEMGCSPSSRLSAEAEKCGMNIKRINLANRYDLYKKHTYDRLEKEADEAPPDRIWASYPCTVWSSQQNANQGTEEQIFSLEQRRAHQRRAYKYFADWIDRLLTKFPHTRGRDALDQLSAGRLRLDAGVKELASLRKPPSHVPDALCPFLAFGQPLALKARGAPGAAG